MRYTVCLHCVCSIFQPPFQNYAGQIRPSLALRTFVSVIIDSGGERAREYEWKRDHVMLYVMYCERVSFDVRHVSHIRVKRYRVHGLWYGAVPLYSHIRQLGTPPAVLTRVATILRRT